MYHPTWVYCMYMDKVGHNSYKNLHFAIRLNLCYLYNFKKMLYHYLIWHNSQQQCSIHTQTWHKHIIFKMHWWVFRHLDSVFCIVGPDFLASLIRGWPGGLLCACFLADGLEGGVPEQAQMVEASRDGPVQSERLNLQTSQPVAPAPQNKWDFNSIRVRLLWPPHGRNYWTYPPPSWNTPARPVPDPHTDTGVVLHIAEFLHSLASQSCFTLSLVLCSLSAAALLSLSLHHTTPFPFLSLFPFLEALWGWTPISAWFCKDSCCS